MQDSICTISRVRISVLLLFVIICSMNFTAGSASLNGNHHLGALSVIRRVSHTARWGHKVPPSYDECVQQLNIRCYSPQQMRNAYSITPLLNAGYIGSGQTIVIIDSFGSPTAAADLARFDADYGLPAPPSFQVLAPLGTVPFDVNNADQVGWAQECNLDIQWAHAMAPGAGIVLLTSPVAETQGVQGMPEFFKLEQYALDHHLGKIVSQSWGTTEETLFTPEGKKILNGFNTFYQQAASREHITFLASAGDTGPLNPDVNNKNYNFPTVGFPASSPWVTTVGGTSLYADRNGTYQGETTWNSGLGSATGGGYSLYFRAPGYQQATLPPTVRAASHGYRGLPDVAYDADPSTSIPVYLGFLPNPDYYLFGGTSAGTPQWAGLVADANQLAGHPLGFLNEKIYRISAMQGATGPVFHDITIGNNAQGSLPGYQATPGWDAVTGWGSPITNLLVAGLVR
ncbi:MAG: S53 family peptidase [Ktedonobacteraceae bacterium]